MNVSMLVWLGLLVSGVALLYVVALASLNSLVWRYHRRLGEVSAGFLLASTPFLATSPVALMWQIFFGIITLTMSILALRFVYDRLHGDFLRRSTLYNLSFLIVAVLIVAACTLSIQKLEWLNWMAVVVVLCVSTTFIIQTVWTLKHFRLRKIDISLKEKDLPTVTLAIPARNETHALTDCLQAAIASDYPKLEILVLDDCSQDKTSQLIRSFAHAGVRFVQGEVPADSWIGKNRAFQALSEHASGEYIVFMGVDTTIAPRSITKLITYALSNHAQMVSVLPEWRGGIEPGGIFQTLRYFWQVVLPISPKRVPVASPLWLIKAHTLRELGGFKSVKQKIMPEGSFARRLQGKDLYRFLMSNHELGVTSAKQWSSQAESSLRLLYPTLRRQPAYMLVAIVLLAVMITPFVNVFILGLDTQDALTWLSPLACIVLWLSYALVVFRTHPRSWVLSTIAFPLLLVQELALCVVSMLAYEFSEVNWKGRNVCYPVLQQIDSAK